MVHIKMLVHETTEISFQMLQNQRKNANWCQRTLGHDFVSSQVMLCLLLNVENFRELFYEMITICLTCL